MAASAQRRVEPPAVARSAERERLARVCEEHNAGLDRLARLRQGLAGARRNSMEALAAAEAAEAAVKVAARAEPARAAAELIGETFQGAGQSLEEAERNLAQAQGRHQHLHKTAQVLEKELAAAEGRQAQTLPRRQAAVAAVLDSDPAMDLLYAEYLATLGWSAALADVFRLIGPSRLPRRLQYWDRTNHELPAVDEPLPVAQWRETLRALEAGEVDTPLPAIG